MIRRYLEHFSGKAWRKGRGYTRYSYTVQDIAQATHRAPGTVRNDIASGKIIMGDLASVAAYLVWYTTRCSGDNAGGNVSD